MALKLERGCYAEPAPIAGENNDCAVRALATAGCVSYLVAHAACAAAGRVKGSRMWPDRFQVAIDALGFAGTPYIGLAVTARRGWPLGTLAAVMRSLPQRGHFIVWVRGHYLAVCDGVVHDWGPNGKAGARRRVYGYWKLA